MNENERCDVFVIFGITGDLAKVMTFRSLYRLEQRKLLEQLWPGVSVSERALTSTIRDLRRALGQSGRPEGWVRTLHGHGYRFVGEVAEAVPIAAATAPRARERAPLLERERELAQLADALEHARAGRGESCLLLGPPGIGKTRMVEELARCAHERGVADVHSTHVRHDDRRILQVELRGEFPQTRIVRGVIVRRVGRRGRDAPGIGEHHRHARLADMRDEIEQCRRGIGGGIVERAVDARVHPSLALGLDLEPRHDPLRVQHVRPQHQRHHHGEHQRGALAHA